MFPQPWASVVRPCHKANEPSTGAKTVWLMPPQNKVPRLHSKPNPHCSGTDRVGPQLHTHHIILLQRAAPARHLPPALLALPDAGLCPLWGLVHPSTHWPSASSDGSLPGQTLLTQALPLVSGPVLSLHSWWGREWLEKRAHSEPGGVFEI